MNLTLFRIMRSMIISASMMLVFVSNTNAQGKQSSDIQLENEYANYPLDQEFNTYVMNTLKEWQAPGALIVVVKDGDPVFLKGYGTRKSGENLPFDENTLIPVASITKAFTTAGLAILADEGKLSWDEPVKKYIPEFRFAGEYVTEHTTVRDVLLHRAGLPGAPGEFNNPDYSFEHLLNDLGTSQPTTGFREYLNYSQVGSALAGYIISRLSGMSWSEFVAQRIFEPLGMTSTYASPSLFEEALGNPNDIENILIRAIKEDGEVTSDEWFGFFGLYEPAASIISTGTDIAQWMIMQLQSGWFDNSRIISKNQIEEMRQPQMLVNIPWARRHNLWWAQIYDHFAPIMGTGLGWISFEYHGRRISEHHGGGASSSVLALVPDENLGIFVTTNAVFPDNAGLHMVDALKLRVLDRLLNLQEINWSAEFLKVHK